MEEWGLGEECEQVHHVRKGLEVENQVHRVLVKVGDKVQVWNNDQQGLIKLNTHLSISHKFHSQVSAQGK